MKNQDQRNVCLAIDRACAELQALKAAIRPSYIRSVELQAESAQCFASYASDVLPIVAALIVDMIETAADLAGQPLCKAARADLTQFDTAKDILQDIYGAAQRMVEETEEAA